jgi:hypothetical protein
MLLAPLGGATAAEPATAKRAPTAKVSAPAKLKWRAKGVVAPAVATESPTPTAKPAARRAIDNQPASNKSSRARLRDAIMQVSNIDEVSDASTEAEPAEAEALETGDETLTAQREPLGSSPAETPAEESPGIEAPATEPAPAADPFGDDSVPAPPTSEPTTSAEPPTAEPTTPMAPLTPSRSRDRDELPPSDLSTGISTSSPTNCNEYQEECKRAIEELLKRDITTIRVGLEITGVEGEDFPCDCKAGMGILDASMTEFRGRNWARTNFAWKASGLCHKPLYFEDVQLERYGHSWNPVLQPFMSAGHFFASVALLPYHMGINPPNECVYALGYYRPGSCAPYMIEPFPLSLRGAAFEAAAVTGFYFWLYP